MVNPAPILCCLWFHLDVNLKVKTLKVEKKWNKNYFKGLILTLICVFCDWSLAGLAKPHGCFSCGFFLLCSTQLSTEQLSLWDSLIAWSTTGPKQHTHTHRQPHVLDCVLLTWIGPVFLLTAHLDTTTHHWIHTRAHREWRTWGKH